MEELADKVVLRAAIECRPTRTENGVQLGMCPQAGQCSTRVVVKVDLGLQVCLPTKGLFHLIGRHRFDRRKMRHQLLALLLGEVPDLPGELRKHANIVDALQGAIALEEEVANRCAALREGLAYAPRRLDAMVVTIFERANADLVALVLQRTLVENRKIDALTQVLGQQLGMMLGLRSPQQLELRPVHVAPCLELAHGQTMLGDTAVQMLA